MVGSTDKPTLMSLLENKLQDQCATPICLPLDFLKSITNNFSDEQELGRGGFGVVYKGNLQNGKSIAVKKLHSVHLTNDHQFNKEVTCLFGLKHKNIVQLVGYCAESRWEATQINKKHVMGEIAQRLICFEYINNKSLHYHLSDESCGLEWYVRYGIVKGICCGLHYLHIDSKIVHLDLKPENIMLDDNMEPKITDFGLARLFGTQQSRIITQSCVGTFGYMAPEYISNGLISSKADIFSLGVIIVELMTGGKDYPISEDAYENFIEKVVGSWIKRLEDAGRYIFLEKYVTQIKTCILIGLKCVNTDPSKRPTAWDIVEKLTEADAADRERGASGIQFVHFNGPTSFTMENLLRAEAAVLSESTYGTVYKAKLEDGSILAVNRLRQDIIKGHKEFKAEVNVLGKVRHPNLLALRAYYMGPMEVVVIYDYMEKGNLSALLHAESYGLEWPVRYEIVRGICRGLHHLHTESQIVHLDLKTENILLDENMKPKIKDFGKYRLFGSQQSRVTNQSRRGTIGYMAPEYLINGLVSSKADIFSLGIIIIELLTGGKVYPITEQAYEHFIENVAGRWRKMLEDAGRYIFLERYVEQIKTCTLIGLKCVDTDPNKRPSAGDILEKLNEADVSNKDSRGPSGRQLLHFDSPIAFTMENLLHAEAAVLGESTYGMVYKAMLENGSTLAVNRLRQDIIKGHKELKAEVDVLGKVRHPNLLALRAYCMGSKEVVLIFDYMPKGSLSALLHESYGLEWPVRYGIVTGICRGLHHLHTECQIIHSDLKTGNILLDDNTKPKIKYFGMSRLFGSQQPRVINQSHGGRMYMAPEYLLNDGSITSKADIFSFGVIIVELLTGGKGYPTTEEAHENFIEEVVRSWRQKLDKAGKYIPLEKYVEQVKTCILIGLMCVDADPNKRPTADVILKKLTEADVSNLQLVHFDGPIAFTKSELLRANKSIIGEATYGTLCKAMLQDGSFVCIRKFKENTVKDHKEFKDEVEVLGKIRHRNVLELRAYYMGLHDNNKFIVFDYMHNGSVYTLLRGKTSGLVSFCSPNTTFSVPNYGYYYMNMDCATLMAIAKGTAHGLACLHANNIIHGNLTTGNILLDEQTQPKIANFGLFRFMTAATNSEVLALSRKLGFSAPELSGDDMRQANAQTDVYSLGIIILELLVGISTKRQDLPQQVACYVREGRTRHVFRTGILGDKGRPSWDELEDTLMVALRCVEVSPFLRPQAHEVLEVLEKVRPPPPVDNNNAIRPDASSPPLVQHLRQPAWRRLLACACVNQPHDNEDDG